MTGGGRPVPPAVPPLPGPEEPSLRDVLPSMASSLGVEGSTDALGLGPLRRVCVLLVDGLGWELLARNAAEAPFLASLLPGASPLACGFPATTATSLASLGTGLPAGRHGMLGYVVAVPGTGRLLNALRWDTDVDPEAWQMNPTVFERVAAAGVSVTRVGRSRFAGSGLTRAALRGGRYVGADTPGDRVAATAAALRDGERSLVYLYEGDLDATGHLRGCDSESWRAQLGQVDRLAEQVAARLPDGALLLVTADHGMIDVPADHRVDAEAIPALGDGVALLGGEARARHVYTRAGAAPDVLAAWRETLGERAWVLARDEAVAAGWFGPEVEAPLRERIGDVVAAATGTYAITATATQPAESALVGQHGSFTADETRVPGLVFRA